MAVARVLLLAVLTLGAGCQASKPQGVSPFAGWEPVETIGAKDWR